MISKYLKLPFLFEAEKLVNELNSISQHQWVDHHYKVNYQGAWTSISLYAKEGDQRNIFAFPGTDANIKETPLLKNCFYFKEVIGHFKCPLISVRLLNLSSGSEIKPHRDYKLGYEDNNFRLHIPITTNDRVDFILDGEKIEMAPGECWYTNVNYTHSVSNKGKEDRVHLVIDGERNTWSDELFFSLAPRESFQLKEDQFSKATVKNMIRELDNLGETVSKELIKTLKKNLTKRYLKE